jgi:hypothetical protein
MKVQALLVSGFLMLSAVQADAQTVQVARLSSAELNQLVAPIALYPDALVAQIAAAATYPTEVVEAERWMEQHSDLRGQALAQAVDQQPWDPSVKALTQFSSVLASMDKNLSWTSSLGEAYVDEPQNVLSAVQVMRRRAQQAGNLTSTSQETVTNDGETIAIAPADPEVVYVPEYDPWTVYGAPVAFYPDWIGVPGAFYYGPGIDFGIGIGLFAGFGWGWHHWDADWHGHDFRYDHHPYISRSPTFDHHGPFDHHDFDHGRPTFGHPDMGRADLGHAGFDHADIDHARIGGYTGFAGGAPVGIHSGAFSGFNHGGATNAYSSRGQASFHGGSGGFHGGGGGGHR